MRLIKAIKVSSLSNLYVHKFTLALLDVRYMLIENPLINGESISKTQKKRKI